MIPRWTATTLALAFGANAWAIDGISSSGGLIRHICNPSTDRGCIGVTTTTPAGGQIEPDPTRRARICAAYFEPAACTDAPEMIGIEVRGRSWALAFAGADREHIYYALVLRGADLAGTGDYDVAGTDIDQDGVNDLILGSPHDSTVAKDAGAVHIFLGPFGERLLNVKAPDLSIFGTEEGSQAGLSVTTMLESEAGAEGFAVNGPSASTEYRVHGDPDLALPEELTDEILYKTE